MAWTAHNDFIAAIAELTVRGQGAIDPARYRFALLTGFTPTRSTPKGALIANELVGANGYSRQPYAPGAGAYDNTQQRYELGSSIAGFTPTGASWSVSGVVLLANSSPNVSAQISAIASSVITVPSHGLANGDQVVISTLDTLPGGVTANTVYFAKSLSVNTFEIYSDAALANKITIANSGTGAQYLRYANGIPALIDPSVSGTFPSGVPVSIALDWAWFNGGDSNGV